MMCFFRNIYIDATKGLHATSFSRAIHAVVRAIYIGAARIINDVFLFRTIYTVAIRIAFHIILCAPYALLPPNNICFTMINLLSDTYIYTT